MQIFRKYSSFAERKFWKTCRPLLKLSTDVSLFFLGPEGRQADRKLKKNSLIEFPPARSCASSRHSNFSGLRIKVREPSDLHLPDRRFIPSRFHKLPSSSFRPFYPVVRQPPLLFLVHGHSKVQKRLLEHADRVASKNSAADKL